MGSRKLIWKEVGKARSGTISTYSRITGRIKRLIMGKDTLREIWKEYFEDPYNADTKK